MKFEMSHTNVGTSKTRFLIKFCNPTPRTGQLDTEISGRGKNFKSDCRIMVIRVVNLFGFSACTVINLSNLLTGLHI